MTGIMAAALSRQNFILPHLFPETTSLEAKCKLNCCKQIREIKENIPIDENNLPNHVNTRKLKNESLKCNHISFEITRASTFFSISSIKYLSLLQWFLLCALYFLVSLSANQHWDPGGSRAECNLARTMISLVFGSIISLSFSNMISFIFVSMISFIFVSFSANHHWDGGGGRAECN